MTPPEPSLRRRWLRLHTVAGVVACLVIPAQSWCEGTRTRAWSMYSKSASYRLRIFASDGPAESRWVAPSELASHVAPDLAAALGGAEGLRLGSEGIALRSHLPRLAELACSVSHAGRVELILEVRRAADAPLRTTREGRDCTTPTSPNDARR